MDPRKDPCGSRPNPVVFSTNELHGRSSEHFNGISIWTFSLYFNPYTSTMGCCCSASLPSTITNGSRGQILLSQEQVSGSLPFEKLSITIEKYLSGSFRRARLHCSHYRIFFRFQQLLWRIAGECPLGGQEITRDYIFCRHKEPDTCSGDGLGCFSL